MSHHAKPIVMAIVGHCAAREKEICRNAPQIVTASAENAAAFYHAYEVCNIRPEGRRHPLPGLSTKVHGKGSRG